MCLCPKCARVKATQPRQKRPRAYRKSGFHGTQRALSKGGISALDGRSAIARAVRDWRASVAGDLGGEEVLSQQQRTLLDVAAQDVVLLSVADGWLRENAEKIVNKRRRALVPLVEQRLKVASHLTGLLKDLGLERRAKALPGLRELMTQAAQARNGTAGDGTGRAPSSDAAESLPGPSESLPGVGQ